MSQTDRYLYLDFQRHQERLEDQLKLLSRRYSSPVFTQNSASQLLGMFVRAFFPPGENRRYFLSNTSLKEEYLDLTVRPATVPENVMLPKGVSLGIRGHLFPMDHEAPRLVANRIVEVVVSLRRSFEVAVEAKCSLSGDHNVANVLTPSLVGQLPEISLRTREQLRHWRDYLDWKRQIIERELSGVRFLDAAVEQDKFVFHIACAGESAFRELEAFFKNESLSVFPLRFSRDLWEFRYASDNRYVPSVPLGDFAGAQPATPAAFAKQLRGAPWDAPFVAAVRFHLTAEDRDQLPSLTSAERQYLFEQRAAQLPDTGFLANSLIGDFTVLYRQQQAMEMLERQFGFAPFLSAWLFDISKASPVSGHAEIDDWLMPNINAGQKQAVQKMLDAPDVALVQGPPGTGKTTVIGEAIYQLARQGKTVLLASQANLAVDNALEKLANVPEIRAIRLGRRHKLSAEGERFAEEHVLEKFYESLAAACEERFLQQWDAQDAKLKHIRSAIAWLEDNEKKPDNNAGDASPEKAAASPRWQALEQLERQITMLIKALRGKETQWAVLPERLQLAVDTAIIKPLQKLREVHIDLWQQPHQPEPLAADETPAHLPALLAAWQSLQQKIPQIAQALQEVRSPQTLDTESLDTLQKQLSAVEAALESGDDSQLVVWRNLRSAIRQIEAAGNPAAEWLAMVFNAAPGLPAALSGDDDQRAEAIAAIEKGEQTLVAASDRIAAAKAKLISYLQEMLGTIEGKRKTLAATAGAPVENPRRQAAYQKFLSDLRENAAVWQSLGWIDPATPTNDAGAIRKALHDFIEQKILSDRDETGFREQWEPFLREWHARLNKIQATRDHPHLIDTYIELCNVVGVTCNENPRLLEGKNKHYFDVAIIDEVSKATPPELLMPMLLARKTILVGDHRQLPPLFKEREGSWEEALEDAPAGLKTLLTRDNFYRFRDMVTASLFKQYFEQAHASLKETLLVQYRMHPQIMAVINHFYENRLKCGLPRPDEQRDHRLSISGSAGQTLIDSRCHALWIDTSRDAQGKPAFERQSGTSKTNPLETSLIVKLLRKMDASYRKAGMGSGRRKAVGVISFYGRQVMEIREALRREQLPTLDIDVNTVDQFQGKEKPIILVSLVRNLPGGASSNMSFVAQFERINVAFSRAQELLVIFGAADTFAGCEVELPNMDKPGSIKKRIYGEIIESLRAGGRLVSTAAMV